MGGVVVDESHGVWGRATATFSTDRAHRYELTRIWGDASGVPPRLVNFVMLNPSTADAFELDPTNRRCARFARDWGFDGLVTTNVFAFRSTDPTGLRSAEDPVGADNDAWIERASSSSALVVAAWGVHARLLNRGDEVSSLLRRVLRRTGGELHVLHLTKAGHPGHPLYLPADTSPVPWVED